MSVIYDIKRDLQDAEIEKIILEKKLKDNKERYDHLCEILKKSARFDESLVFLIAELMTYKEDYPYSPFIYEESEVFLGTNFKNSNVGIASDDIISDYMDNNIVINNDFFDNKLGFIVFEKESVVVENEIENKIIDFYDFKETESYPREISFDFVLKNFNIKNYRTNYEFEDFEYVQDYISYLFELQLKNNGRHLTYDEMDQALDEFLELENEQKLSLNK